MGAVTYTAYNTADDIGGTAINTKPESASAASHVADWLRAIETLDPGSPKYEAYATRLAALGVKRDI